MDHPAGTRDNDQPGIVSFGPYLRFIRIEKGFGIDEIACELKVHPEKIAAIEDQRHDLLPDEVYVKGILKSYARVLGLDEADIIDRYLINRMEFYKAAGHVSGGSASKRRAKTWNLFWLVVFLAAGLCLWFALVLDGTREDIRVEKEAPADVTIISGSVLPASGMFSVSIDAGAFVDIVALIDHETEERFSLAPNDHLELGGRSFIRFRFSDSGAVSLCVNGEPEIIPGAAPGKSLVVDIVYRPKE